MTLANGKIGFSVLEVAAEVDIVAPAAASVNADVDVDDCVGKIASRKMGGDAGGK